MNIWISTLGPAEPIPVDEEMDYPIPADLRNSPHARRHLSLYLIILLIAAAIYVGCMVSPPSLMDDVDSVQAQICGRCSIPEIG